MAMGALMPLVEQMQKIVAELLIVFPTDAGMVMCNTSLANKLVALQSCSGLQQLCSMTSTLSKVVTSSEPKVSDIAELVAKLAQGLSSNKHLEQKGGLGDDEVQGMQNAWIEFVKYLSNCCIGTKTSSLSAPDTVQFLTVCAELPRVMGFQTEQTNALACLMSLLHEGYQKFVAFDGIELTIDVLLKEDKDRQKMSSLMRSVMKLDSQVARMDKMKWANQQNDVLLKLKAAVKLPKELSASLSVAWQSHVNDGVKLAKKQLLGVAGGVKDGHMWLDKIEKKTSVKDMQGMLKDGTLMDVEPALLISAIADMKEAYDKYKDVLGSCTKEPDAALVKEIDDLLCKGQSTKSAACILDHLNVLKDEKKLRQAVKSEIVQLRGLVGKDNEKSHFPKKLWDKIQSVLGA
eukprot:6490772-Amphidinium_carterae.1